MNDHSSRGRLFTVILALAAAVLLALAALTQYMRAERLQNEERIRNESLTGQLSETLDALHEVLLKTRCTASPSMMHTLAIQAAGEARTAKVLLSLMTGTGTDLAAANRFLSQAGAYVSSLASRMSAGEELADEDRESLSKMTDYSKELSQSVSRLRLSIYDGEANLPEAAAFPTEDEPDAFAEVSGVEAYPTLVYDGPFSDGLLQRRALAVENLPDVTAETAQKTAETAAKRSFTPDGERGGSLPCYLFTDGESEVSVTKQGGLICGVSVFRGIDAARYSPEDALSAASEFIARAGYDNMENMSVKTTGGECVAEFAKREGDVLFYPDLIRVGVALDTCEVVWFDAATYLTDRHERDLLQPVITPEEGLKHLSRELKNSRFVTRAVIETTGGGEADCYEYEAENGGRTVKIYLDCTTGDERAILTE